MLDEAIADVGGGLDDLTVDIDKLTAALDVDGFTDADVADLLTLWSDMDTAARALRVMRATLGRLLGERMESPEVVGSTVYVPKSRPVEHWGPPEPMRLELLYRSAQRDSHTAVTDDGEPIAEPAYRAGWDAAATLWNLAPRDVRKRAIHGLGVTVEDLGCEITWERTVEIKR